MVFRYRLQGTRQPIINISGINLLSTQFDFKRQRVLPSHPQFKRFNQRIQNIIDGVDERNFNGGFRNNDSVINLINNESEVTPTLLEFIDRVIPELTNRRKESTARQYNWIRRFIAASVYKEMEVTQMNPRWITDLAKLLCNTTKEGSNNIYYSENSIRQFLDGFKRITKHGVDSGMLNNNPFPQKLNLTNYLREENRKREIHYPLKVAWWWSLENLRKDKFVELDKSDAIQKTLKERMNEQGGKIQEDELIYFYELEKFLEQPKGERIITGKFERLKRVINNLTPKKLVRIRQTYDAYRFCYFTSFRFSDVVHNGKEGSGMLPKYIQWTKEKQYVVKKLAFKMRTSTNKKYQIIPISLIYWGLAAEIFEQYQKGENEYLFDKLGKEVGMFNKYLNILATMANFHIELKKPLSSHTARSTFIWMAKKVIKLGQAERMSMTGHDTEKMDAHYAGDESEIAYSALERVFKNST